MIISQITKYIFETLEQQRTPKSKNQIEARLLLKTLLYVANPLGSQKYNRKEAVEHHHLPQVNPSMKSMEGKLNRIVYLGFVQIKSCKDQFLLKMKNKNSEKSIPLFLPFQTPGWLVATALLEIIKENMRNRKKIKIKKPDNLKKNLLKI